MNAKHMQISDSDKILINSILEDVRNYRISHNWDQNEVVLISFDVLFNEILKLNTEKINICKRFLSINPVEYGFTGIKYDFNGDIDASVFKKIKNQHLQNSTRVNTQYITPFGYSKLRKLNRFMFKEIGKSIIVQSGFRSPAYQLVVFFWNIRHFNYDFDYVVRKVALPFYSEHGYFDGQAIDIMTYDSTGFFEKERIEKTEEYAWLKRNGECFGLFESYSKNNKLGVMYEPWHWHFEGKK